jgi:hypothetical protein
MICATLTAIAVSFFAMTRMGSLEGENSLGGTTQSEYDEGMSPSSRLAKLVCSVHSCKWIHPGNAQTRDATANFDENSAQESNKISCK